MAQILHSDGGKNKCFESAARWPANVEDTVCPIAPLGRLQKMCYADAHSEHVVQQGSVILLNGDAMTGSVEQIIKLLGLYVLCYREFVSKPECKGGYFVLDNQELQEEMHAIEISACGVVRMYFASGVWCLC